MDEPTSKPQPLAYESLKVVLQYMDPNQRLQMISRIPAIRATDRIIPLKIDTLGLGCYQYEINGTSYTLSKIRVYPEGSIPENLKEAMKIGGIHFDLNDQGDISYFYESEGQLVVKSEQAYQTMFLFKITSPNGITLRHQFLNQIPISDAMTKINQMYFGNRKLVHVRHLKYVKWDHIPFEPNHDGKSMEIGELFQTCKKLVIDGLLERNVYSTLKAFPKREVVFRSNTSEIYVDDFLHLVKYEWIDHPVGMSYSVDISDERVAVELLDLLEVMMNGKRQGERHVIFAVNETSQMSVSYDAAVPADPRKWTLKFQMLPV